MLYQTCRCLFSSLTVYANFNFNFNLDSLHRGVQPDRAPPTRQETGRAAQSGEQFQEFESEELQETRTARGNARQAGMPGRNPRRNPEPICSGYRACCRVPALIYSLAWCWLQDHWKSAKCQNEK